MTALLTLPPKPAGAAMDTSPQPIKRRGLMLVLSSPSGGGKTSIVRALLERDPNVCVSISVTTRPRRPAETEGIDYHFIDKPTFQRMVDEGELLEHAQAYGNFYGTPKAPVEAMLAAGQDVLFDIEWQGAQQIAQGARGDLVTIFVLPPNVTELERRLRHRGQDADDVIIRRMAKAGDEMSHWAEYDYVIINRDVTESTDHVQAILTAERLRRRRQQGLAHFVKALQSQL